MTRIEVARLPTLAFLVVLFSTAVHADDGETVVLPEQEIVVERNTEEALPPDEDELDYDALFLPVDESHLETALDVAPDGPATLEPRFSWNAAIAAASTAGCLSALPVLCGNPIGWLVVIVGSGLVTYSVEGAQQAGLGAATGAAIGIFSAFLVCVGLFIASGLLFGVINVPALASLGLRDAARSPEVGLAMTGSLLLTAIAVELAGPALGAGLFAGFARAGAEPSLAEAREPLLVRLLSRDREGDAKAH